MASRRGGSNSNSRGGGSRTSLLVLGVVFHALYVLSIFDIYFKSPVVTHIESLHYAAPATSVLTAPSVSSAPSQSSSSSLLAAPAKRVVVFVADGCRADKFFEMTNSTADSSNAAGGTTNRASFLHHIIATQGSWGVSHTRVPTESRPGHVALFAGMYEDVSAVTKGWQDNPVDFDSVFNQSRFSWLFGSPDIVPMFTRTVPHAVDEHYSHEHEDFAKDASELDVWVYDAVAALFKRAQTDAALDARLRAPQVVFFCHFLGIDTNGHAHRPQSRDYLDNIALVDALVERVVRLVDAFYQDDHATAFVFTADHGMSNKGAHGDGDPANTRTPLVVWGAGVHGPSPVDNANVTATANAFAIELVTQSAADVRHQLAAQTAQETAAFSDWDEALRDLTRKDVMQADVAPLISSLLGLPFPRNSVGVLPFMYLAKGPYRALAVRSNAQQLFLHALRKAQEKEAQTLLLFKPFGPFRDAAPALRVELDALWNARDFVGVERTSQALIAICLDTLEYFQRYDWAFLLTVIVSGYVGWMLVIAIAFVAPRAFQWRLLLAPTDVRLGVLLFTAASFLALESAPVTYYLYAVFPIVFWNFVLRHHTLLRVGSDTKHDTGGVWRWLEAASVVVGLEFVVLGFERRWIFGVLFTLLGLAWPVLLHQDALASGSRVVSTTRRAYASWTASCLFISVFPYLPTEHGDHLLLVVTGGVVLIALALVATTKLTATGASFAKWPVAFAAALAASLVTVQWTMQFLSTKQKPPVALTLANWVLAIAPIAALLVRLTLRRLHGDRNNQIALSLSPRSSLESLTDAEQSLKRNALLLRLVEIVLACSPAYVLLSISYEVFFFLALCCVLTSWIVVEAQLSSSASASSTQAMRLRDEVRRAFYFLLLIKIAFFGTGNVASMSSFELSSTYRFTTVFAPFLMGALLVIKLLIPFLVVACAFHVVLELNQPPRRRVVDSNTVNHRRYPPSRYFLLVVGMSDVLALHFLFLVKHEGSWKAIGNSISMFGIVNALIVFVPLLFVLAKVFVRDLLDEGESDRDDATEETRKTQ